MASALKDQIVEDMKNAMRAHDKERLGAIRLILAAVKQIEVDERIELDDARVAVILSKMVKQRQDSIEQFNAANRKDLVDKENFELSVIQNYLPKQLSDSEIDELIQGVISETGAASIKDLGKVMAALKPKIQGRADGSVVSQKVKQLLS